MDELEVKPWIQKPHQSFYITNARIIDAKNETVSEELQAVKVVNGQIISVIPASSAELDSNEPVTDIGGRYLCPGLIDAHVHVTAVPGVQVRRHLLSVSLTS